MKLPYLSLSTGSLASAGSRFAALLLTSLLLTEASAQNPVVITPVAEVGSAAPGTAGNWSALSSSRVAVGIDGGVSFQGTVATLDGLWYGDKDSLDLVGLEGDAAPGTAANFTSFNNSFSPYSSLGVGFYSRLSDGTDSLWTAPTGGVPQLLAVEGAVAPGTGGAVFNIVERASVNNSGETLFRGLLNLTGFRTLWRSPAAGPIAYIARQGEAMNAVVGSSYNVIGAEYAINDNGTACFHTTLSGGGVTTANDTVLLTLEDPAPVAPTLIAREGDVAPGTGGLRNFAAFSSVYINDDEDVLFRATLDTAAPLSSNIGVWLYDSTTSTTDLVAREGDAAPGVAGAFFDSFEELFLADGEIVAIVAMARDTADGSGSMIGRGVWLDAGAGLELVAMVGQNALKRDGVTVHGSITAILQVTMNMAGDLALEMTAGGTNGVWRREAVAASPTRQLLAVGDKVYDTNRRGRTVTIVNLPEADGYTAFGGGPFGRSRSLNEDGAPLLALNFATGSGLYFADQEPLNALISSRNEEAPGTAVGTLMDSIRPAGTLNNNGLVAFRGHLQNNTGDAVTGVSGEGIWAEQLVGGIPQLNLVARQGDPTPEGDTYGSLLVNPIYNDNGSIAFPALLDGGGAAFFAGPIGSLAKVMKTGDPVNITGIPSGAVYKLVRSFFAYNNGGRLVAGSSFEPDSNLGITVGNDSAILRHGTGARVIAREGASVGTGTAGVFGDLYNRTVYINSADRVAFLADRRYNPAIGITQANWSGIWYHSGTALSRVAAGGTTQNTQLAPSAGGAQFLKPTHLVFNDANRIGFRTTLQGSGVTPSVNDVALYISNAGVLPVLLARTGSTQLSGVGPAGVDDAATFASLGRPDIDASTKLVFRGGLTVGAGGVTTSNDDALWANSAGTTSLLLREGGFAPDSSGAPTADVFESFEDPVIGTNGRVVVVARMRIGVGSIVAGNDRALFVQGANGQFYRVVQKGQSVSLADGLGGSANQQIANISYPNAAGGAGGSYKTITTEGFVLAYLTFANGATASMIFLAP